MDSTISSQEPEPEPEAPSPRGLSPAAARQLGSDFRFARQRQDLTLRDVARRSGVSLQYVLNIEQGSKLNVSEEVFRRLAQALLIPIDTTDDMLLRARVTSALELRGLTPDQRVTVWTSLEIAFRRVGIDIRKNLHDWLDGLL